MQLYIDHRYRSSLTAPKVSTTICTLLFLSYSTRISLTSLSSVCLRLLTAFTFDCNRSFSYRKASIYYFIWSIYKRLVSEVFEVSDEILEYWEVFPTLCCNWRTLDFRISICCALPFQAFSSINNWSKLIVSPPTSRCRTRMALLTSLFKFWIYRRCSWTFLSASFHFYLSSS